MNLYDYYSKPKELDLYQEVDKGAPDIFWMKYNDNPSELKKREYAIAKSSQYSYMYASNVLCGPFPLGEPAIATYGYWSYAYAKNVIKGPFPLGEPAINSIPFYKRNYDKFLEELR